MRACADKQCTRTLHIILAAQTIADVPLQETLRKAIVIIQTKSFILFAKSMCVHTCLCVAGVCYLGHNVLVRESCGRYLLDALGCARVYDYHLK